MNETENRAEEISNHDVISAHKERTKMKVQKGSKWSLRKRVDAEISLLTLDLRSPGWTYNFLRIHGSCYLLW
eukprot:5169950-Amphidinium_carterae.1